MLEFQERFYQDCRAAGHLTQLGSPLLQFCAVIRVTARLLPELDDVCWHNLRLLLLAQPLQAASLWVPSPVDWSPKQMALLHCTS